MARVIVDPDHGSAGGPAEREAEDCRGRGGGGCPEEAPEQWLPDFTRPRSGGCRESMKRPDRRASDGRLAADPAGAPEEAVQGAAPARCRPRRAGEGRQGFATGRVATLWLERTTEAIRDGSSRERALPTSRISTPRTHSGGNATSAQPRQGRGPGYIASRTLRHRSGSRAGRSRSCRPP